MLFNSNAFIFLFLPAALAGFIVLGARVPGRPKLAALWLVAASAVFYAWSVPVYLVLLASSILFNYAVSVEMAAAGRDARYRKRLLVAAIAVNLGLLAA